MSDNQKNLDTENMEAAAEAAETTETEETAEVDCAEGKLKCGDKKRLKKVETELTETKKKLEAAEATLAEEKDKYLRMLAEYDNFRRRTAKEKETIYGDAVAETVKGLLPVVDTLERAAAGLSPEDAESPLGKGITMTLKSAVDALTKLGVEEVPHDVFNPDIHNAVMHVEDDSLPEDAIVAVFQKGYRKGDHIIRYAMVQVAN
jgi:molecular chaperone GrpE